MNYISTRDKKTYFDFKSIFLRGLASDGGLFLPEKLRKYSKDDLQRLSKLNYFDLASEIISNFSEPFLKKDKIKLLNQVVTYFELHLQQFKSPKSLEILNEIFKVP